MFIWFSFLLDVKKSDRPDVAPERTCFCKNDDSFFFHHNTSQLPSHQATMTSPAPTNHNAAAAAANNITTIRVLRQFSHSRADLLWCRHHTTVVHSGECYHMHCSAVLRGERGVCNYYYLLVETAEDLDSASIIYIT